MNANIGFTGKVICVRELRYLKWSQCVKRAFLNLISLQILIMTTGSYPLVAAELKASRTAASDNVATVYDGAVLTEDVTWRGDIIVKGSVVVAPQATLRLEPGTVVRFSGSSSLNGSARLVVLGRIQAMGTAARPILMTSAKPTAARGDWGGLYFVSSEKRNVLEHCRIEYADSGIDAHFSSISLKNITVAKSQTALRAHDAVVQMTGGTVSDSDTGIEAYDSEFDVRDTFITTCRRGFVLIRTAAGIASSKITANEQNGLLAEDSRVKISSGEISQNGVGARFKGGEGQIQATRFNRNRDTALHLSGTRVKVQRCQFVENSRDAIRLEDSRPLISGNAFSANKGFNLYNAGRENVNALLNWWGTSEQLAISQKIHDAVRDPNSGTVQFFPWLNEKPALMP
jgi:hypothetical protein